MTKVVLLFATPIPSTSDELENSTHACLPNEYDISPFDDGKLLRQSPPHNSANCTSIPSSHVPLHQPLRATKLLPYLFGNVLIFPEPTLLTSHVPPPLPTDMPLRASPSHKHSTYPFPTHAPIHSRSRRSIRTK
jgi:hypothetical protein